MTSTDEDVRNVIRVVSAVEDKVVDEANDAVGDDGICCVQGAEVAQFAIDHIFLVGGSVRSK